MINADQLIKEESFDRIEINSRTAKVSGDETFKLTAKLKALRHFVKIT